MFMDRIARLDMEVAVSSRLVDLARRAHRALGRQRVPTCPIERARMRDAFKASLTRLRHAEGRLEKAKAARKRFAPPTATIEDRRSEPWAMASNPYAGPPVMVITLPDLVA